MSSLLLRGGLVVTMDRQRRVFAGDVLIQGECVAAVSPVPIPVGEDTQVIDAAGKIIMPGLVQAHVHLCQVLFRGLCDDMTVVDWLRERIWPLEQAHNEASVYASALLGAAELLRGGTTCILSMESVNGTDGAFQAMVESGLRGFTGKAMMDMHEKGTELLGEETEYSWAETMRLIERWDGAAGGRVGYALCPRGPRNCTPELLRRIQEFADANGLLVHTHAAENGDLTRAVVAETGIRDIELLDKYGLAHDRLVAAHCVHLDSHEQEIMASRGASVAHCPSANLKLASGLAQIPEMLDKGINVALGADGAPCNNNLSAFQEMRLAGLIHKPRVGPKAMPATTVLELATLNGARALGLEDKIGSLEPGKLADVITVNVRGLHNRPCGFTEAASQLVYALAAHDVDTTIVGGRVLMQDGQLTELNAYQVAARAERALAELLVRARLDSYPTRIFDRGWQ